MAKTNFIDTNPSQGILGTLVTASFLNKLGLHRHDGLDDDGHGLLDYAVAGGTANALTVALNPPLTQLIPGMPIYILITAANTGPMTLAVDALGPVPLLKSGGMEMRDGDLRPGMIICVQAAGDKSSYQVTSRLADVDSILSRIGTSGPAGYRNKLINGSLQVWQLGTFFTVPAGQSSWSADQIIIYNNTNQTLTVAFQRANASENYVPAMTLSFGTAPTSGDVTIVPTVPDATTLQNGDVTLSYYCGTVESLVITADVSQHFGTGGSTTVTTNLPGSVNPNGKLLRYSSTAILPSVVGKTFGSNHKIYPAIHIPIRTTSPVTLALIQLERGKSASNFEMLSYEDELRRCLPFVQILDYVSVFRVIDSPYYGGGMTEICYAPMHHPPSVLLSHINGNGTYSMWSYAGRSSGIVYFTNTLPAVGAWEQFQVTLLARL